MSKIPKQGIRNEINSSPLPRSQIYFCSTAFRFETLENDACNSRDCPYLLGQKLFTSNEMTESIQK